MNMKHAMWTRWACIGGLMLATAVVTACAPGHDYLDPYQKPYTWHPTDAPTANLAAQLVNPRDLVMGHGDTEGDAKEATGAVERDWQDRVKQIGGGGSAGGPGASAGGAGASGSGAGGTN